MAASPIRKPKKKSNPLVTAKIGYIDYKDTTPAAQVHLGPRQDPRPSCDRRQLAQQREIAKAIKNAREMALLPYTSTTRNPVRQDDKDETHSYREVSGLGLAGDIVRLPTATAVTTSYHRPGHQLSTGAEKQIAQIKRRATPVRAATYRTRRRSRRTWKPCQ